MGIDGFMILIGGMVIVAGAFGFYKFIQYMKKNRKSVNDKIKNITEKL
jgi:hypothetical protein